MELTAATSQFLTDRTDRGCNPLTVRWYRDVLKVFVRDCGVSQLEAVTIDLLRAYVVHLQCAVPGLRTTRMSPVTVRKRVLSLKTFFAWASRCDPPLLHPDPAYKLVSPKAPRRIPRALSRDQAARFLNAPMSPRDRAIVYVMLDTGIRLAECCRLDLSDVEENQGTILVRFGKGGKQRTVVFSPLTRAALEAWITLRGTLRLRDTSALFPSKDGDRISRSGMQKVIKRIARSVGMGDQVAPHWLRHTFATHYLRAGGELHNVSELLGHEDITTTMIYLLPDVEDLRDKHVAFSPLLRLKK